MIKQVYNLKSADFELKSLYEFLSYLVTKYEDTSQSSDESYLLSSLTVDLYLENGQNIVLSYDNNAFVEETKQLISDEFNNLRGINFWLRTNSLKVTFEAINDKFSSVIKLSVEASTKSEFLLVSDDAKKKIGWKENSNRIVHSVIFLPAIVVACQIVNSYAFLKLVNGKFSDRAETLILLVSFFVLGTVGVIIALYCEHRYAGVVFRKGKLKTAELFRDDKNKIITALVAAVLIAVVLNILGL